MSEHRVSENDEETGEVCTDDGTFLGWRETNQSTIRDKRTKLILIHDTVQIRKEEKSPHHPSTARHLQSRFSLPSDVDGRITQLSSPFVKTRPS